ncbi:hypothetical protein APHAL10511_002338 [Amanita phalloides]|nr:hypothetical protein APHAL10511_002338 [Amanita phalloides]
MPHKRAKRSAREELCRQRGADLAPGKESLSTEVTSKSASRVLNAEKIRQEWKFKKRLASEGGPRVDKRRKVDNEDKGDAHSLKSPHWKIQPGEPIQHFHRRVEDGMRPIIKSTIQASRATMKPLPGDAQTRSALLRQLRRASTSLPRRLNDVAKAPPSLTALPRKVVDGQGTGEGDPEVQVTQGQPASITACGRCQCLHVFVPLLKKTLRTSHKATAYEVNLSNSGAIRVDGLILVCWGLSCSIEHTETAAKRHLIQLNLCGRGNAT